MQPAKLPQAWQLSPADELPLLAGEYVLRIQYRGKVQATGSGLFKVPYTARGKPALMLATQLEAVFARMVFPCFDEPAFRAVFEISVKAPSAYEAHSNMPRTASTTKDGVTEHHFAATPSMPTYLVAVTVGRFATVKSEAAGIPLRILTAEGKQTQAAYALAISKQLVPYFTDYFGIRYSLPKLDQLAVPGIRDGAMEDWGLISYSEDSILFDPARSSFNARRNVFNLWRTRSRINGSATSSLRLRGRKSGSTKRLRRGWKSKRASSSTRSGMNACGGADGWIRR